LVDVVAYGGARDGIFPSDENPCQAEEERQPSNGGGRDCETEEAVHDRLEMLLNLTPRSGLFWIGGDLGYTNDPTELVVFQEMEIGERSLLKMIFRLHLEHGTYPHIAQVIALLERYYTPAGIGVDNGGNGLAVVQELLTQNKYKGLELEGRLKGYDFGGMTRLAVRDGRVIYSKGNDHVIDAVRCAMLVREEGNLDPMGEETVSLKPVFTDPVFI
jgi:hypothetical protein